MKNQNTMEATNDKVQSAYEMYLDDQFQYNTSATQWKAIKTIIAHYSNSYNEEFNVKGEVLRYEEFPNVYSWTNKLGQITMFNKAFGLMLMSCQPQHVEQWVAKINNYIQSLQK